VQSADCSCCSCCSRECAADCLQCAGRAQTVCSARLRPNSLGRCGKRRARPQLDWQPHRLGRPFGPPWNRRLSAQLGPPPGKLLHQNVDCAAGKSSHVAREAADWQPERRPPSLSSRVQTVASGATRVQSASARVSSAFVQTAAGHCCQQACVGFCALHVAWWPQFVAGQMCQRGAESVRQLRRPFNSNAARFVFGPHAQPKHTHTQLSLWLGRPI